MKTTIKKIRKTEEMNLVPMMNLMTVLIPFLLSITAFAKISTIDIGVRPGGSNTNPDTTKKKDEKPKDKLELTLLVSDQGLTLGAKGGFLPTVFTKEQWKFKDDESGNFYVLDVDSASLATMRKDRVVNVPDAGRAMSLAERSEILLMATTQQSPEDAPVVVKTIHTPMDEILVTKEFAPIRLKDLTAGDTLINLDRYVKYQRVVRRIEELDKQIKESEHEGYIAEKKSERDEATAYKNSINYIMIYENNNGLTELPTSAYDILLTRLLKVRQMYAGAPDIDEIAITCENEIIYDKVVRIIDMSKLSGFVAVKMARFRS